MMIKKDNADFHDFTKWRICDNGHINGNVKVKDHCHITGKYRGSTNSNINIQLNHKTPAVLHNLVLMQELGKFNLKINVTPNGLEKYLIFSVNNWVFHSIA